MAVKDFCPGIEHVINGFVNIPDAGPKIRETILAKEANANFVAWEERKKECAVRAGFYYEDTTTRWS